MAFLNSSYVQNVLTLADPMSVITGFSDQAYQVMATEFMLPKTITHMVEKKILFFLIRTGNTGKTRAQIAAALDCPRTTVFDAISRLSVVGLIEFDYKHSKTKTGRPQTLYFTKMRPQGNRR